MVWYAKVWYITMQCGVVEHCIGSMIYVIIQYGICCSKMWYGTIGLHNLWVHWRFSVTKPNILSSIFYDHYSRGMKFENVSVLVESLAEITEDIRYCWYVNIF